MDYTVYLNKNQQIGQNIKSRYMLMIRDMIIRTERLKVKGWIEVLHQKNPNQKKAGTAILLTHKIRL